MRVCDFVCEMRELVCVLFRVCARTRAIGVRRSKCVRMSDSVISALHAHVVEQGGRHRLRSRFVAAPAIVCVQSSLLEGIVCAMVARCRIVP